MSKTSPELISHCFGSCPVLEELIRTQVSIGRTGKQFEGLSALSTTNNLKKLRYLMECFRPTRTLEVGLCFGGSTLTFTASHRDLGREPAAQHVAIDPFQETYWDSAGLAAVERAGLSGYLDYRSTFSARELPRMLDDGDQFGLIYIDGSHLFEDVFVDAFFAIRLLENGGIVAFDDCSDPHVAKVLRFLRTNLVGHLSEMKAGQIISGTWKSQFRYRLARLLGRGQFTAFRRVGDANRNWAAEFRKF